MDLEEQWRLLNKKRKRVWDLRAIIAEKKRILKPLRQQASNAGNAFMNATRHLMVNKTALHNETDSHLNTLFAEMQRLHSESQDLETSCEELEDEVGQEERQLQRIEFRFFSLLAGDDGEMSDGSSSGHDDSHINDLPDELLGISPDRPLEDWHPLFHQLTFAAASLRSAEEEVTTLQSISKLCEEKWIERSHGQKLAREMADFLVEYPTLVKTKKAELKQCRQEVDRLRAMCEERQAMAKHLPVRLDLALNTDADPEDIALPDNDTILQEYGAMPPPRFSEILSQPDHLLTSPEPLTAEAAKKVADRLPDSNPDKMRIVRHATKELEIDSLSLFGDEEDDKNNNINRWLLHNLRSSPLDASLLHSVFVTTQGLRILDPHRWQRDVLYYWWRDKIPRITNFTETSARRSISRAVSEGANETQISYIQRKAYSTS
jgi:predicted  nucleic acid-binding Zn-ribbon protein